MGLRQLFKWFVFPRTMRKDTPSWNNTYSPIGDELVVTPLDGSALYQQDYDGKIQTPLDTGGFIRGTVWKVAKSPPTIVGPITNAANVAVIAEGEYAQLLSVRNTGGSGATLTLLNADAAAAVGNTILITATINAATEINFLNSALVQAGPIMYGPVYAIMSANSATYIAKQTYGHVKQNTSN